MKEAAKVAAVRAVRTFAQTAAGVIVAFPAIEKVADVKVLGDPFLAGLLFSLTSAAVTFLQNFAEELKDPRVGQGPSSTLPPNPQG